MTRSQAKLPAGPDQHLQRIPLDQIDVPRSRIRRQFGAIRELASSLGSVGLLQPIHVLESRSRYRLIAGERRLRAARMLGWTEIDALVRTPRGDELLLELVENAQRKFLTDAEEADALIRLVRDERHQLAHVAAQAGRSQAYVSKRIRVFEDMTLRSALAQNRLSVSMAEEFLSVPGDQRAGLVAVAIREHWDVVRLRETIRSGQVGVAADTHISPLLAPRLEGMSALARTQPFEAGPRTPEPAAGLGRPRTVRTRTEGVETPERADVSMLDDLNAVRTAISNLDPRQITASEERALAELLDALLALAQALRKRGAGKAFPARLRPSDGAPTFGPKST